MSDYEIRYAGDAVVITVAVTRATLREAKEFKNVVQGEIAKKKFKMVVDLSQCEFMDSTFVGVLVVTLKQISDFGGEMRLVEPASIAHTILLTTRTLNIFNVCATVDEALEQFAAVGARV